MKARFICLVCICLLTHVLPGGTPATVEARRQSALGSEIPRLERADGRIFTDVRITAIDDGGISIRHASGTARLRYADLTPAQRERYGITKTDARTTYQRENQRQAAYEQAVQVKEKERALRAELEAEALRLEAQAAAEKSTEKTIQNQETPPASGTIPELPALDVESAFNSKVIRGSRYSRTTERYRYFPYSGRYWPTYYRETRHPRNPRSFCSSYYKTYRGPSFHIVIP